MSWDVSVFKFVGETPKSMDDFSKENFRPLGGAQMVRAMISKCLPEVDWSDLSWGMYEKDFVSFEFNVGSDETIDSIMVHVRGGGDPIRKLLDFATPCGWVLLDCSTGELISEDNPNQDGWEGFKEYRDNL